MPFWKNNNSSNDNDHDLKADRREQQRSAERQKQTGESSRDQAKSTSGRESANKTAKYVADKQSGGKATPEQRETLHRDISKKGISNDDLKSGVKKK